MKFIHLLGLFITTNLAAADSWVFWECQEFLKFCESSEDGSTCVSSNSFWVQYDQPNGGGNIVKHSVTFNTDKAGVDTQDSVCPPNNIVTGNQDGNGFEVLYKYFDSGANGEALPCPEGDLFEPDGVTLLGHNDGSGTNPPNGGGDGFCADSSATCLCTAYVTVNSP